MTGGIVITTQAAQRILIVGAGFAGATYARVLAEAGHHVQVIDQRHHVAGNAFDETDENGVRRHRYGPHLFHTNNQEVVRWIERFGKMIRYEHRVKALIAPDRLVPLPINRRTLEVVFNRELVNPEAVEALLADLAQPVAFPENAADYLHSKIGRALTDLFFRPYTRKMWGLDLEDMSAAVVQRIPLRMDDEDRYFPGDQFQFLPQDGYTALFERMLDHPLIKVNLCTPFEKWMTRDFDHCFNSMAIDAYHDEVFGPLPYRSIRFHHETVAEESSGEPRPATINFTDSGPLTRVTCWSSLPGHRLVATGRTTLTSEEPCDYRDNGYERYYPVKTSDGRFNETYRQYRALADRDPHMTFIGRCGTYQYLDMHQVIAQSIKGAQDYASRVG